MASDLKTVYPVRTIVVDEPLLKTGCTLGEGPLWDPAAQILHFLDIDKHQVFHYTPKTGELTMDQYEEPIGCLALRKAGGLACAAKRGFGILEPSDPSDPLKGPTIRYLSQPLPSEYTAKARFNDGACDPRGRFWAGTLEFKLGDKHVPGQLWVYDHKEKTSKLVDDRDITDSNGLGWSKDLKTLYFTNSTIKQIYSYEYDVETGEATNRRSFIDEPEMGLSKKDYGNPDGLCIDREGSIWCARWEGSRVVRFTPDGKKIDLEIHIPKAYNVTACCFGGPNLDQLYITTAMSFANVHKPDSVNEALQKQFPDSGHVFVVDFSKVDQQVFGDIGPRIGDVNWRYEFQD